MKLIAKRDFRNVDGAIEIENHQHPNHIHMGATFSIGKSDKFEQLTRAEKELVTQLNSADCIGDATDEKVVKAVKAAVDERDKREAALNPKPKAEPKK